jgi:hypothetical protein
VSTYPQNFPPELRASDVLDAAIEFPWHVAAEGSTVPVRSLQCRACGALEFEVGQGDGLTAVRCVVCSYEVAIHEARSLR